jgi:hypothetical protein
MALFARPLHATKLDQRLPARLFCGHPRRDIPLNGQIQMELQFFIQRISFPLQENKWKGAKPFQHHD